MRFPRHINPIAFAWFVVCDYVRHAFCSHVCDTNGITVQSRGDDGTPRVVQASCLKCGKVLRGPYGLALPCSWSHS